MTSKRTYSDEEELLGEVTTSGEGCATDNAKYAHGYRRLLAYALGGVALVACAAVLVVTTAPSNDDGRMTAMHIFDSPRIHEVATDNMMHVSRKLMGKELVGARGPMRRLVEIGFKNATAHLRKFHPEAARGLDNIHLTKAHEAALAHVLGFVSDERAARLGLKIAHAMRDTRPDAKEDELRKEIGKALFPHMHELMQLHIEMYPKGSPLRKSVHEGFVQETLHPARVRMMKSVGNGWDKLYREDAAASDSSRKLQFSPNSQYATPAGQQSNDPLGGLFGSGSGNEDAGPSFGTGIQATDMPEGLTMNTLGLAGAAMEEAGTLLRIMKPIAKQMGTDLNVPTDVTTGVGAANLALEFGSCEADAAADDFNPLELAACPVEFSSQAMDASRDIFTYLGLLGDNNPANGQQGNHNGENKKDAKLGLLDDLGWADQDDVDGFDLFNDD